MNAVTLAAFFYAHKSSPVGGPGPTPVGKMAQLARNPHVELCYMDAERRHLRLQGTAEEVNDGTMKQKLWDENPMLHQYFRSPDSPDYRLIKIVVTEALLMDTNDRGYQRLSI